MTLRDKQRILKENIKNRGSMLVAFSGGVDSTLLAVISLEVLGDKSHCILLDSEVISRTVRDQACRLAHELGFQLEIIRVPLLEHEKFCKNPADRCYFCKKISSAFLKQRAED